MATIYIGSAIKEVRVRRALTRTEIMEELPFYAPSMSRIEAGNMVPLNGTREELSRVLDFPMDELICFRLENQPMDVYIMRYDLCTALDRRDEDGAADLFDKFSLLPNFDTPVNRQCLLNFQSRLLELQGHPPEFIMPMVHDGLKQTLKGFCGESPGNTILIFDEAELFHTKARLHAKMGDLPTAIQILSEVADELISYPAGDRQMDKQLVRALLSLSRFQHQAGNYNAALVTCNSGRDVSANRYHGLHMPDFALIKALSLAELKPTHSKEHRKLLRQAYFGFEILHQRKAAEEVLAIAKAKFGYEINRHGVDTRVYESIQKASYARGDVIECTSLSEMIKLLHDRTKLTAKSLCSGICSESNFNKILQGKIETKMYIAEPVMQRLGRYVHHYANFYLSKADYKETLMRNKIHQLSVTGNYEAAETLLATLKEKKAYKSRANLQFVKRVEIDIFIENNGYKHRRIPRMIREALCVTCPGFDEEKIHEYPLTHDESILINMLGGHYVEIKRLDRARNIYKLLLDNLNKRFVDGEEKARLYATVLYNYSRCLGRMGLREEALKIIEIGEVFEVRHDRLFPELSNLVYNKAYNYFELGRKEESAPYFALSYYVAELFEDYGHAGAAKITRERVERHFGIVYE